MLRRNGERKSSAGFCWCGFYVRTEPGGIEAFSPTLHHVFRSICWNRIVQSGDITYLWCAEEPFILPACTNALTCLCSFKWVMDDMPINSWYKYSSLNSEFLPQRPKFKNRMTWSMSLTFWLWVVIYFNIKNCESKSRGFKSGNPTDYVATAIQLTLLLIIVFTLILLYSTAYIVFFSLLKLLI